MVLQNAFCTLQFYDNKYYLQELNTFVRNITTNLKKTKIINLRFDEIIKKRFVIQTIKTLLWKPNTPVDNNYFFPVYIPAMSQLTN